MKGLPYWLAGPLVMTICGWALWFLTPGAAARDVFLGFAGGATLATVVGLALVALSAPRRRK